MTRPTVLPPLSPRQAQLVAQLVPLIQKLARETKRMFPGLSRDDLAGAGNLAAVGVALRFNPDDGTPLEAFARKRLRGAMIDAALALQSSSAHALARLMRVGVRAGREEAPTTIDLDGPSPRELLDARVRRRAASLLTSHFTQPNAVDAEEAAIAKETHALGIAALARATAELSEEERKVLTAFHQDGLTIDEVADKLGLSRSTARRLHDRAKKKLADSLRRQGVEHAVVGEE